MKPKLRHRYHSLQHRALTSFQILFGVTAFGTIGIHRLEGLNMLDSFYLMSMITTAQGPFYAPTTTAGKLFIAFMSFVGVGAGVTALGFLFGPFMGKLWKVGVEKFEEEVETLHKKRSE